MAVLLAATCAQLSPVNAIDIVLDYTLDANNANWFGGTPNGLARRAALDSAAGFLSAIITNDDWASLGSLNEQFSLSDIAVSTITNLDGEIVSGEPESDGEGYAYDISTTNRSSVAENEYIVYVGAFEFDAGTSSHAKGGWDSNDRRNAAGMAQTEFNTWGGKIYFDSSDDWYAGQNPGIDPVDDYGFQDPNKMPGTDISTDNWDWSTSSDSWKGFDLETIDPLADGQNDLYAVGLHELMHALGATSTNMSNYVGVDGDNLIGDNVVEEFGGPVPRDGGHFDNNVQSEVWASDGIISEVVLDPNSVRGNRKYFTKLDAALLRDLGYQVSDGLVFADFDQDGDVDGNDFLTWQRDPNVGSLAGWRAEYGTQNLAAGCIGNSGTVGSIVFPPGVDPCHPSSPRPVLG